MASGSQDVRTESAVNTFTSTAHNVQDNASEVSWRGPGRFGNPGEGSWRRRGRGSWRGSRGHGGFGPCSYSYRFDHPPGAQRDLSVGPGYSGFTNDRGSLFGSSARNLDSLWASSQDTAFTTQPGGQKYTNSPNFIPAFPTLLTQGVSATQSISQSTARPAYSVELLPSSTSTHQPSATQSAYPSLVYSRLTSTVQPTDHSTTQFVYPDLQSSPAAPIAQQTDPSATQFVDSTSLPSPAAESIVHSTERTFTAHNTQAGNGHPIPYLGPSSLLASTAFSVSSSPNLDANFSATSERSAFGSSALASANSNGNNTLNLEAPTSSPSPQPTLGSNHQQQSPSASLLPLAKSLLMPTPALPFPQPRATFRLEPNNNNTSGNMQPHRHHQQEAFLPFGGEDPDLGHDMTPYHYSYDYNNSNNPGGGLQQHQQPYGQHPYGQQNLNYNYGHQYPQGQYPQGQYPQDQYPQDQYPMQQYHGQPPFIQAQQSTNFYDTAGAPSGMHMNQLHAGMAAIRMDPNFPNMPGGPMPTIDPNTSASGVPGGGGASATKKQRISVLGFNNDVYHTPSQLFQMLTSEDKVHTLEEMLQHFPFVKSSALFTPTATTGVVHVGNMKYGAAREEVLAIFGRSSRAANDRDEPVHIILDRVNGKTMDAFVEFLTPQDAHDAVEKLRGSRRYHKIGDRNVTVQLSSHSELQGALFPRAKGLRWLDDATPVLEEAREDEPFNRFKCCPFTQNCPQRPYESWISTLRRFPWHNPELFTVGEQFELYHVTEKMIRQLASVIQSQDEGGSSARGGHGGSGDSNRGLVRLNHHRRNNSDCTSGGNSTGTGISISPQSKLSRALLRRLVLAAISCPGFSVLQRDNISALLSEDFSIELSFHNPHSANLWWFVRGVSLKPDVPLDVVSLYVEHIRRITTDWSAALLDHECRAGNDEYINACMPNQDPSIGRDVFGYLFALLGYPFPEPLKGSYWSMTMREMADREMNAMLLFLQAGFPSGQTGSPLLELTQIPHPGEKDFDNKMIEVQNLVGGFGLGDCANDQRGHALSPPSIRNANTAGASAPSGHGSDFARHADCANTGRDTFERTPISPLDARCKHQTRRRSESYHLGTGGHQHTPQHQTSAFHTIPPAPASLPQRPQKGKTPPPKISKGFMNPPALSGQAGSGGGSYAKGLHQGLGGDAGIWGGSPSHITSGSTPGLGGDRRGDNKDADTDNTPAATAAGPATAVSSPGQSQGHGNGHSYSSPSYAHSAFGNFRYAAGMVNPNHLSLQGAFGSASVSGSASHRTSIAGTSGYGATSTSGPGITTGIGAGPGASPFKTPGRLPPKSWSMQTFPSIAEHDEHNSATKAPGAAGSMGGTSQGDTAGASSPFGPYQQQAHSGYPTLGDGCDVPGASTPASINAPAPASRFGIASTAAFPGKSTSFNQLPAVRASADPFFSPPPRTEVSVPSVIASSITTSAATATSTATATAGGTSGTPARTGARNLAAIKSSSYGQIPRLGLDSDPLSGHSHSAAAASSSPSSSRTQTQAKKHYGRDSFLAASRAGGLDPIAAPSARLASSRPAGGGGGASVSQDADKKKQKKKKQKEREDMARSYSEIIDSDVSSDGGEDDPDGLPSGGGGVRLADFEDDNDDEAAEARPGTGTGTGGVTSTSTTTSSTIRALLASSPARGPTGSRKGLGPAVDACAKPKQQQQQQQRAPGASSSSAAAEAKEARMRGGNWRDGASGAGGAPPPPPPPPASLSAAAPAGRK
ncbi:hypothetical protein MKZ38_000982 [Zalerion maritima]|uniref:RRM domain-containing protein n=1 Tax=Zalerion maritima TaxID=339359 RepID=A0AAD5RFN7_9PEZI|nr:hypothetical protein MKZ38_000982 [Zalerion maritima]